jgi:hypothetical protein
MPEPKTVAVIGAGAAGLVTARELLRAGHTVQVFEKASDVGGVWQYQEPAEDNLLGSTDSPIHTSMYASLRTNLPRDLMAFLDYTFDSAGGGDDAWPRFPHHTMVKEYLQRFARDFDLLPHIHFDTAVVSLRRIDSAWQLVASEDSETQTFSFDAVAVCNGHYAKPYVPEIDGMSDFPGVLLHSHNYRHPEPFAGQTVALLGVSVSGTDIHHELADVAEHVYLCGYPFNNPENQRDKGNISYRPAIQSMRADGRLVFIDGALSEPIDSFMFCTGYHFSFPFIGDELVTVDDNYVQPLYQHLLHIGQPTLAFIGIPIRVIPFPLFEMQARWFAKHLNGDVVLPPQAEMKRMNEAAIGPLRSAGKPQHFHVLGDAQSNYYNALARQCEEPDLPDWFLQVMGAHFSNAQKGRGFQDRPLPALGPTVVPPESISYS